MKKATLLSSNGLELPCIVLPTQRNLFPIGKEVTVYCQNRLVKGYVEDDDELVAELEVIVEWAIIPELEELLKETQNLNEIYYL